MILAFVANKAVGGWRWLLALLLAWLDGEWFRADGAFLDP
jgi:hypothetical protein